jgi:aminotransferase in exopolysaccharide biosynthesis
MSERFIPLSVPSLKGNELEYVTECVKTNWVSTAGSFVNRFEIEMAEYAGVRFAVAVINGTAALHVAMKTLGIGPGDEVLVPTLTFIAPVNAVNYTGADPVFMDCDDHLNINPTKLVEFCEKECSFDGQRLTDNKTGKTVKAVIPVHIFGHPVDIEPIMDVAEKYNLYVIEDAAESMGSGYISGRYKGKKTGAVGHIGCYSFNGNKIITAGGGGMVVTDDPEIAQHARYLTTQARDDELYYVHDNIGYNYRLTNVEAAIGVAQLEQLDGFVETKRKNFNLYRELLKDIEGLSFIEEQSYARSNCWLHTIVVNGNGMSRDGMLKALQANDIESRPVWKLNHEQKPYVGYRTYRIERAPYWYDRALCLPSSVGIEEDEIERVCAVIREQASI